MVYSDSIVRRCLAEAAGTFGLVLLGTGAIVLDDHLGGNLGGGGVALAFGATVTGMIVLFGAVSGAHINPAVTAGFWARRMLSGPMAAGYLGAQVTGALAASAALRALAPDHPSLGATLPAIGLPAAFGLEVALTATLMFGILASGLVARRVRLPPAVLIGGIVGAASWVAGPFTGASMNPARSLGPALVSGCTEHCWLYVAAPICGAVLVARTAWRPHRPPAPSPRPS